MIARYTACIVLPLFVAFSISATAQVCDTIPPRQQSTNLSKLEKGNISFGLKLFQTLNGLQKQNDNICISPFSAGMALSMTLNGAEGETLEQMRATLGLSELNVGEINCAYRNVADDLENTGADLEFGNANSIWIRKGFPVHKQFTAVNWDAYDAEVSALDFRSPKAAKEINGWVKEQTKEKISSIVPEKIPEETMMYIINAIYLKGMWKTEFNREKTGRETFMLSGGEEIKHELMSVEGEFRHATLADGTQLIELPYKTREKEGEFSMIVILPPEGKEINEFIRAFDERSFLRTFDALDRYGKSEGTLYLPKFKLEYEEGLKDALTSMGMKSAFGEGADFSKMSDQSLYISQVRQKTFVEVNEEGTEAAAVTAVEMIADSSISPPHFLMRVNRPFLFLIASADPDTILFFGKVVDPR